MVKYMIHRKISEKGSRKSKKRFELNPITYKQKKYMSKFVGR